VTVPREDVPGSGPLVIVGGYGHIGEQTARLLRTRHPQLPLVLAGRNPGTARQLAEQLDASTAHVDVLAPRPLAELPERPCSILAAVADARDRLLVDAMREGIPIADISRAEPVPVLDAMLRALRTPPDSAVLLAGGWKCGASALLAAVLAWMVAVPSRIALTVLLSGRDRVGEGSWSFSRRWAWPHHMLDGGRRRAVHPFTDARRTQCADGRARTSVRVSTLDQVTLPMTLDVPTVETRFAMLEPSKLGALMALKRSGALRMLDRPQLRRLRRQVLERSGMGDVSGFTLAVTGADRTLALDVLDVRGQAHLSAVGAVLAAERVAGLTDARLPAGVSFPEQSAQPATDLATLAAAGVALHPHGCTLEEIGRAGALEALR
jgi:hypothetical protein